MILGFDFLGFQAIKHFPTKNRIFLLVMQCTVTNNSFLFVFYSYVLVFYPYVTGMYLVCTRMLLVCNRMYSYVLVCYSYVLVWCFSHDLRTESFERRRSTWKWALTLLFLIYDIKSHVFVFLLTINRSRPIGKRTNFVTAIVQKYRTYVFGIHCQIARQQVDGSW